MPRFTLQETIERLETLYGQFPELCPTEPWLAVLWENVGYIADDQRRLAALNVLKKTVGISPRQILVADQAKLEIVTGYGGIPYEYAHRLRRCAASLQRESTDNLEGVLKLSVREACKVLMKFPGVPRPVAEKILLFAKAHKLFVCDVNGLRVLTRMGLARDEKSFDATHRAVQQAAAGEIKDDYDWLIKAYRLLRKHGQELCRLTSPSCDRCPLIAGCGRYGIGA